MTEDKHVLFESDELTNAIARMAHQVIESTPTLSDLVLVGIRSRGVHLARRMARKIHDLRKILPPVGVLDVSRYRDDRRGGVETVPGAPLQMAVALDGKTVVLVDDVIFRGRTIRAALDAVLQFGAPKRILVAVLVDRGARELPIRADIVGKNVEAGEGYRVNVMLEEFDGLDRIVVGRWMSRARD
jgi:pyrimidine operon attenuation protein/uracil phosphoribosyltransferase